MLAVLSTARKLPEDQHAIARNPCADPTTIRRSANVHWLLTDSRYEEGNVTGVFTANTSCTITYRVHEIALNARYREIWQR